jgi:hypothetical protein
VKLRITNLQAASADAEKLAAGDYFMVSYAGSPGTAGLRTDRAYIMTDAPEDKLPGETYTTRGYRTAVDLITGARIAIAPFTAVMKCEVEISITVEMQEIVRDTEAVKAR